MASSLSRTAGEGAERSEAGEGARGGTDPHPPTPAAWAPPSPAVRERGLKRGVVVLFPRVLKLLAAQHGEGAAGALAGWCRLGQLVYQAPARPSRQVAEILRH